MISLLLHPWCGTFMQLQGTQWDTRGWMISKRVFIHPGQDSHTILRHGTDPQQTNLSRVHGAYQAGRQVYKNISPRTSINHSYSPSWGSGRQYYTKVGIATKRITHTCNTPKQVLHRWHRQIPCTVKKWKPVCYGGLSLFQCNFSFSL